jgi:hypothetical protein
LGDPSRPKWVHSVEFNLQPDTGVSVLPRSDIDRKSTPVSMKEIFSQSTARAIRTLRKIPGGNLRSMYHQLLLSNASSVLAVSSTRALQAEGFVTVSVPGVSATIRRLTIDSAASFIWPASIANLVLTLSQDDFSLECAVTTREDDKNILVSYAGGSTVFTAGRDYMRLFLRTDQAGVATPTFNPVAGNRLTLVNALNSFPQDLIGYSVLLATDNYTAEYPIVARVSNTSIKVTGAGWPSGSPATHWWIKGPIKGNILHLLSLSVNLITLKPDSLPGYPGQGGVGD